MMFNVGSANIWNSSFFKSHRPFRILQHLFFKSLNLRAWNGVWWGLISLHLLISCKWLASNKVKNKLINDPCLVDTSEQAVLGRVYWPGLALALSVLRSSGIFLGWIPMDLNSQPGLHQNSHRFRNQPVLQGPL